MFLFVTLDGQINSEMSFYCRYIKIKKLRKELGDPYSMNRCLDRVVKSSYLLLVG